MSLTEFAIPIVPLVQNLVYCIVVAAYSHIFALTISLIYRMFGNGTTATIKSDPLAACIWRLGCHWLGAVIGLAALLGVF